MTKSTRSLLLTALAVFVSSIGVTTAHAAGPVKLDLSSHIGWEVNTVTKGNVCQVECQSASGSGEPGGFEFPEGVAVASDGNVYIADRANNRVQVLNAAGEFVSMFGAEVNETTKGDVCTAEEIKSLAVKCEKGIPGSEVGAFDQPQSVTAEPSGTEENIYVEDVGNWAIDKYSPSGVFIERIGKEVNETEDDTPGASEAEQNLCTAASKDICKAGTQGASEGAAQSAFDFEQGVVGVGDQLAIGPGPEHLLYVGDHQRIDMFTADGEWKNSFELPGTITSSEPSGGITGIALDDSSDTIYVVYARQATVHELDAETGAEMQGVINVPQAAVVFGIAVDADDHLVIADRNEASERIFYVYKASDGSFISSSIVPESAGNIAGIGLGEDERLYAASRNQEVLSYNLLPVGEFKTGSGVCNAGPAQETSDTFDCVLGGEVNPYKIPNTEASFEWGRTCAFGSHTSARSLAPVEATIAFSATIEGLRPNEALCFRSTGHDQNAQAPEILAGEAVGFSTPPVLPKIVATSASFATSSSVDLFAELNPENAPTEYNFELAAEPNAELKLASCRDAREDSCPGVISTAAGESGIFGKVGVTLEATDLQADTVYRYRLNADNHQETKAELRALSDEGTFTTIDTPVVTAATGAAHTVTQTGAVVEGSVDPDGIQATYTFELGVFEGSGTQYVVVSSGSTGSSTDAEPESLALTGLQPGVTYAYRVSIHGGYGSAVGAIGIFTTVALPALLPASIALPQLALPPISFPKPPVTCKHGYVLNKQGKCEKTKAKVSKPKKRQKKKKSKK